VLFANTYFKKAPRVALKNKKAAHGGFT